MAATYLSQLSDCSLIGDLITVQWAEAYSLHDQEVEYSLQQSDDFQLINRSLVEKFGSLVRLTPRLLRPASSPGRGMWVI